jgi:hypothetical protein
VGRRRFRLFFSIFLISCGVGLVLCCWKEIVSNHMMAMTWFGRWGERSVQEGIGVPYDQVGFARARTLLAHI